MHHPPWLRGAWLAAALLAPATPVAAEVTAPRIVVIDAVTGAPVPGATLSLDGVAVGATDQAGACPWTSPTTTGDLVIEAPGYALQLVALADAFAGPLRLEPLAAGETIEVRDTAPTAVAGAARLQRADLARVPGTGGDSLASLDLLAGVTQGAGGPVGYRGIAIRGSSPQDSRILVDGFEIPFLYHAIGARAVVPTAALATIDYLPGGFDVGYGGATSGVVAITTRGGGATPTVEADLSALEASALGTSPVGPGQVMVGLRRSVIDLVLPSLLPSDLDLSLTTVPNYWDGQLRYDVALSPRWQLAASALGARDAAELYTDDEQDPDQRLAFATDFVRATVEGRWTDGGDAARLAASVMDGGVNATAGLRDHNDYRQTALGLRGDGSWTRDALGLRNVTTRAGASLDASRYRYDISTPNDVDEGEPRTSDFMEQPPRLEARGAMWRTSGAAWASVAADLTPRARLTAGLRADGYVELRDVALQPRGELKLRLTDATVARLSVGSYRRAPDYQDELLAVGVGPERAVQSVVGVEHALADGVVATLAAYHTDRSHLLTRALGPAYQNVGRGQTVGAELTLTVRRGPWLALGTYAYAHSTRVDAPGRSVRLFDQDQPHDANLALSWERGAWQLGGRARYSSGLPLTPVIGATYLSDRDTYAPQFGPVNSTRLPAHAQLDLRVDYRWRWAGTRLAAYLDVQNVTMNAPIVGVGYAYDYSRPEPTSGLPILPTIGLRGER